MSWDYRCTEMYKKISSFLRISARIFFFFCGGFRHVSERDLSPFNGANPSPITNADFMRKLHGISDVTFFHT